MGNDADDFDTFWNLYPRKIARGYARKIFARLSAEQKFAAIQAIPLHTRYWKISGRAWEYLPHPSSWLNGECWEDELEMPEATVSNDWMKTQTGIAAKAKEIGVVPKVGEGWMELKARILGVMKAA